jgi:hypothetical protein
MKWGLKKKRLGHGRGRSASRESMHPVRDWITGLVIATAVFLGAVALVVHDFRVQFVLPPEATDTATISTKYSEADVRQYAERFEARDAAFQALRGGHTIPYDPIPSISDTELDSGSLDPETADEYTTPTPAL